MPGPTFIPVDYVKALKNKVTRQLLPPMIASNATLAALVRDAEIELLKLNPDPLRCQALVEQINRVR